MNFGALFLKIAADLKANKPRPDALPPSHAQLIAVLTEAKADLPAVIAWCKDNPGAFTAVDDLLDALEVAGFAWAHALREAIDALPGGLETANEWLPEALFFLGGAFDPAPAWTPGPGTYRGR